MSGVPLWNIIIAVCILYLMIKVFRRNTVSSSVREFPKHKGKRPPTPEPNYICSNCGMLVETGHGHTRTECEQYDSNGYTPDLRAMKTILPSRNQPKIHLPFYYEEALTTYLDAKEPQK